MNLRPLLAAVLLAPACQTLESDVGRLDPDILSRITSSPIRRPVTDRDTSDFLDIEPPPPPRVADDSEVALDLRGSTLAEAVHLIASQAGINIYFDAGLDSPVDASFPKVSLDDALQTLLQRNGLKLVEEPAGMFWVRALRGGEPARKAFRLRSVAAADVADGVQGLVGENVTVVVDSVQNVILIDGDQGAVDMVEEYLAAVDRLKPQVLVEVTILEAILDESFNLGLSGGFQDEWNDAAYSVLTNLASPGNAFSLTLSDQDGDPNVALNALRRYVGLELVSAPRVIAITNTEATVDVVEEVPFIQVTSTTQTGDGLGSNVLEEVEYKEAGVKLRTTPTIQDQGTLQIAISLELSEVVDFFNDIPILDKRTIVNSFLVQDNETIVLGGLMQDRRRDIDEGVPLLMHVPLLGRLFRSDEDATERRELLVFVTPRILDPSQAAEMATHYQNHYRETRRHVAESISAPNEEVEVEKDHEFEEYKSLVPPAEREDEASIEHEAGSEGDEE